MNTMTFDKLQYNELKEIVKSHCVSVLGKELIDKLQPSTILKVVQNRLTETTEARRLLDAESHLPLKGISNINHLMEKLEKGMILAPTELITISDFLRGCRIIKKFMMGKEFFAPILHSFAYSMTDFQSIEEEINYAIRGGRVDSEASKELKRIRNQIAKAEEKIEERLNKFLKSSANKEYIQEFFISKKDDRFTVPIKASYKNQVAGTIVEISSKGSTVFIEPAAVSKLNAELATLKAEEAMEEYQILATLSGSILERIRQISINIEVIAQYDMIFAKAKYSKSIDGMEPKLNNHGFIKLNITALRIPLPNLFDLVGECEAFFIFLILGFRYIVLQPQSLRLQLLKPYNFGSKSMVSNKKQVLLGTLYECNANSHEN